jgi:hypothetical protein
MRLTSAHYDLTTRWPDDPEGHGAMRHEAWLERASPEDGNGAEENSEENSEE